jgi:tetratricopeptide (TPR) repeat protein
MALVVPFQFDDLHQIAQNPVFRDPASLPRFFTDPWIGSVAGHSFFYRPVLFITFLWDGMIGGGSPIPYRLTSIALLVVFALLAGRFSETFLARLLPGRSPDLYTRVGFVASLLLCVHPLLNESVLLATGRSSLLMGTLGLWGLLLLVSAKEGHTRDVAVAGVTILALLTKETAVVLAPLAVLVVWVARSGQPTVRRLGAAWPVVVPVVVYTVLYLGATRHGWFFEPAPEPFPRGLGSGQSPADRWAVGLLSLLGLARLALVPLGLSLIHPVPAVAAPLRAAAPVVWVLGLLLFGYLVGRKAAAPRLAGLAGLWFGLALGPIVTAGLNTPMAEHRAVLALVGPAIAVAWGLVAIRPARLAGVATGGLVAALVAAALAQSLSWRSPITLWQHEARRHPSSDRPWGFLSLAYEEAGDLPKASQAIDRALDLSPHNILYLTRTADLKMQQGDLEGAGRFTAAGLAVDPSYSPILRLETERLARSGRLNEALVVARRAVDAAPRVSAGWNALGNVQLMMDDRHALESYRRALELDSGNTEAAQNLEMARRRWGG